MTHVIGTQNQLSSEFLQQMNLLMGQFNGQKGNNQPAADDELRQYAILRSNPHGIENDGLRPNF